MDEKPVGTVLREARKKHRIKQQELAAQMGISVWTLNRVEHNTRSFDESWVELLPDEICAAVRAVLNTDLRRRFERINRIGEYKMLAGAEA